MQRYLEPTGGEPNSEVTAVSSTETAPSKWPQHAVQEVEGDYRIAVPKVEEGYPEWIYTYHRGPLVKTLIATGVILTTAAVATSGGYLANSFQHLSQADFTVRDSFDVARPQWWPDWIRHTYSWFAGQAS